MNYWTTAENDYLRTSYTTCKKTEIMNCLPDRTWATICTNAKKLNAGNRRAAGLGSGRKYFVDDNYFKEIDTEEKAYWLGFLCADGNISKGGSIRVTLIVEGKTHLEKLKKALNFTGEVKENDYTYDLTKKKYTLEFRHKGMAADLAIFGVIPSKTYSVSFPNIPKELRRHFIRGIFDGDGCITLKKTKYKTTVYTTPSFSICGAVPKFLEDIVQIFVDEVGVTGNKVLRSAIKKENRKTKAEYSAWKFCYQGTPALRIRDWLYNGATVWMECKKDKFYSYDYASKRPRDKKHQEIIIDKLVAKRGWKRLSEYIGFDNCMTVQCDQGHVYTTTVSMLKLNKGCPKCRNKQTGERQTNMGIENLLKIFEQKNWTLLSEYSSEGDITIRCNHGRIFTKRRKQAIKRHVQCDCHKEIK